MRKRFAYVALSALLFVGAGCAAKQEASLEAQVPGPNAAMEAKTGAAVELNAAGTVDATVNAIIDGVDAEMKAETEANADATVNDTAELNAFSEGSYELK